MTIDKLIKPFIREDIYINYILPYLSNMFLNKIEKNNYLLKELKNFNLSEDNIFVNKIDIITFIKKHLCTYYMEDLVNIEYILFLNRKKYDFDLDIISTNIKKFTINYVYDNHIIIYANLNIIAKDFSLDNIKELLLEKKSDLKLII
jgi:hypothetical protein